MKKKMIGKIVKYAFSIMDVYEPVIGAVTPTIKDTTLSKLKDKALAILREKNPTLIVNKEEMK